MLKNEKKVVNEKVFKSKKPKKICQKRPFFLSQRADFYDNRGFLFRFELIKKKLKKTDRHFFLTILRRRL